MLQMLRCDSRREPEPWSCLIRRWHFLLTEYSQTKGITFNDTVHHSKDLRYPQKSGGYQSSSTILHTWFVGVASSLSYHSFF